MSSAKRLQELMDYLGVNATEFGKMTGIPKSSVSMYLSGQRQMRADRIGDISEKFGIDPAWLMGRDVPMRKPVEVADVVEVPIYGRVAAGNGVCAYEDVSDYVPPPAYFGDSFIFKGFPIFFDFTRFFKVRI